MTSRKVIRDWLFMGLAVEEALAELEADGIAVRGTSNIETTQRGVPLESFSADVRVRAVKALPAYLALFCLENAVRELVSERLRENYGANWWETCATTRMKERVAARKDKEGKNRWHSKRGEHEIQYTDFGDLRLLITNCWDDFEDLFPDQSWVSSRLDEMENSRNVVAHTNVLDRREIDRMRLYLEDWVRQVG